MISFAGCARLEEVNFHLMPRISKLRVKKRGSIRSRSITNLSTITLDAKLSELLKRGVMKEDASSSVDMSERRLVLAQSMREHWLSALSKLLKHEPLKPN